MIIADSDVLIDALRGRRKAAERIRLEIEVGMLCTTAVTAFELRSGAKGTRASESVEHLLGAMRILPFDEAASEEAASIRRVLEANGTSIGMADYLIAGICLAHRAILLTRNRAHFSRVPRLAIGRLDLNEPD